MAAVASGQDVRVKVAVVDGAPVYHWRVFDPVIAVDIRDDVDRALIIREFERGGYVLKEHFVDDALNLEIAQHYGVTDTK